MGNPEKGSVAEDPLELVSKETKRSIARCIFAGYIGTDKSKHWQPRSSKKIVCSTMKPSEEAKAEEDIRDGRWVPGVLRGWPKRDSEPENQDRNAASGIFDDVNDPGPPPEPVEKMREKLGKKKLPPVDRKAKETRNEVLGGLFDDLDDAPPETMEELKNKPEPEDPPKWARKPEKVMRRGKKEEPEEENKD